MRIDVLAKASGVIVATGVSLLLMASPALAMGITVQPQGGTAIALDVNPSDTVRSVKTKIEDESGSAPSTICLVFNSQRLDDGSLLSDYSVQAGDVLSQYLIPFSARWSITPDEPVLGTVVHNYVDTIPLPSTNFTVIGGSLPQGVTLNASSGIVDGTFAAMGPFAVTIHAINLCGASDISWSGDVIAAPIPVAPRSPELANTGSNGQIVSLLAGFGALALLIGAGFSARRVSKK
jgi:LPXTG-motif cell wall-anchored protein